MAYQVVLKPSAAKELRRLSRDVLRRVDSQLLELAANPRPIAAIKLTGMPGLYRVRVGDYRIIYRIEDDRLVVLIARIRHRREVYRAGLA